MQKLQGWVEAGNTTLSIGGASGVIARKVQGSYPGATVTVYQNNPIAAAISAIARASNVVTVTVPSNSGFIAGESVTIAGVSNGTFNGTFTILTTGATTFTYAQTAADASSSGGTAASSLRLATIYSDDATVPTSKANPFVSATDGTWFLYAANGRYNVKFSGAGIAAPFTLGDFYIHDLSDLGIYNVMEYGATGNGSTDDRAALNTLANTTIPATGGTMFFPPNTYKISSNITFPSYVTLQFNNGAKLSIDNGIVVTISGTIGAPLNTIFAGAGSVSISALHVPKVYPQWFGATGDGTTDDTTAVTSAVAALTPGSTLHFPPGYYKMSSLALTATERMYSVEGDGWSTVVNDVKGNGQWAVLSNHQGSVLYFTNTSGVLLDISTGTLPVQLRDIMILGSGGTATGIKLGAAIVPKSTLSWSNVFVANTNLAFDFHNVQTSRFSYLSSRGNTNGFVLDDATNDNGYFRVEIQSGTGRAIDVEAAQNNAFYSGIVQACPDGDGIYVGSIASNNNAFRDFWFENLNGFDHAVNVQNGSNTIISNARMATPYDRINVASTPPYDTVFEDIRNIGASTVVNAGRRTRFVGSNLNAITDTGIDTYTLNTVANSTNDIDTPLITTAEARTTTIKPVLPAGSAIFAMDASGGSAQTVVTDGTITPIGNASNFSGMFIVQDDWFGDTVLFITGGGGIAKIAESTTTHYSTTLNNAGTINVYLVGNVVTVQNKVAASSINIKVLPFRTRASQ